ncbi:hypothetical protein ES319_D07G221400v1 [Gossypium barbadense]|uniref:MHD1 domain-containing protein n=2 Tax=Gossypium TaxID=3633 RepID=A0A5J5QTQ5_GOSBA|nr:uncharacterized protein LOC105803850 [Gossypium raimondii]KAB2022565.1 hypothetical protein ES319_D07G221400v1 [Gossypium barbadense]TYG62510.1 hypothetical protein ES288_D07G238100v1 [Gossypium darwinii]
MFTEGLDESAINWINQGKETDQEPRIRSPLTEKLAPHDSFPKSPLIYNTATLLSPHVLPPPLKFRSGLLGPHSVIAPALHEDDDDSNEDESVASVSDDISGGDAGNGIFSDEEEMFERTKCSSKLTRGFSKQDLKVELPDTNRRFTDGDLGIKDFAKKDLTSAATGGGSFGLRERVQIHNAHGTIRGYVNNTFKDVEDLGTPSAPPILDIGREGSDEEEIEQIQDGTYKPVQADCFDVSAEGLPVLKSESLSCPELAEERVNETANTNKEEKMPYWQNNMSDDLHHYNASGQYAWQTLIAYDACIRLCLYAWARGCPEAPEFLRDECLLLRSAFGLHKFLLQPRGVQPVEVSTTKSVEQVSLKAKKIVGKIRVEVKKLRIIPRRKLRSMYSQRSAMYMQVGAEYVRHVSSLVKTGMNSLKIGSFPVASEEPLSCLFQLKSATEDTKVEPSSAICLHPGGGDYHVFFPETEGDALLVEVQDKKKLVQGRATIPVSSLSDNPNERIRWWPIYHEDEECVGKIQLSIGSTITSDETSQIKSGPVVETLAYDLLLEASMRAQCFHSRNLRLQGPWQWLLTEFADYYGVSDSYTKLRYLLHVMNVATPTKDCLELVNELLVPILKARNEKSLTRQEKGILLGCETQIESLLANAFENYKSLDEKSPTGLADLFGPTQETAAPALAPAVQVYTLLHDILSPDAQTTLRNYLQTAARKRCRKHMIETDEFVSNNSEGFLLDSITISTAYLKMKNLCTNISKEIQADIKIHNQHILPSSIDLSNITAEVYSTELCKRLTSFLAAWPPSCPASHVNELLIAIADFERDLESWNISPVQGGVDSRSLFHNYIMVWVEDMQLKLLDLCKAEKVPWSGVTTNHSTSPFAEEMYEKIKDSLIGYEVVINRWPQYSLVLENAVANVERAIIKALEKQYNDILTPLKDSIPKRLNMHVQKLTRRQSTALYSVPSQLGIFLNTVKRILDALHCRVEDVLKSWAACLPITGDKKSLFGEQMNGITVMLRTKYKNYLQATVEKLVNNTQANRNTRLKRILEEIKEEDGEAEIRERMQMLSSQLIDSISNINEVFTSRIFVATCRGFWDRMGQIVLKFLEGRKENRVWYNGSYYALGILDDTFASQMQRLQGNQLQEKDVEPPRSVIEARSILCREPANATDSSTYFYV